MISSINIKQARSLTIFYHKLCTAIIDTKRVFFLGTCYRTTVHDLKKVKHNKISSQQIPAITAL